MYKSKNNITETPYTIKYNKNQIYKLEQIFPNIRKDIFNLVYFFSLKFQK